MDDKKTKSICKKFKNARREYFKTYPDQAPKMSDYVASNLVDLKKHGADEIWDVLWDKPVRAYIRVKSGENKVQAAKEFFEKKWSQIGQNPQDYEIKLWQEKKLNKAGWFNTIDRFNVIGPTIRHIRKKTRMGKKRLFQIQNAAIDFYERVNNKSGVIFPELQHDNLEKFIKYGGLEDAIPKLESSFGKHFGIITVCHFLTDLGLAVKPDMHLMNTLEKIGAWDKSKGWDRKKERYTLSKLEHILEVNSICCDLAMDTYKNVSSDSLRRIDIELMGISLNKDGWDFKEFKDGKNP